MEVTCNHYAILYKGFEHPRILVQGGALEPTPCGFWGKAVVDEVLIV